MIMKLQLFSFFVEQCIAMPKVEKYEIKKVFELNRC